MKGDFSRLTFRPGKHYSSVRMQQGRVQLDSDWNEQMDILLHNLETEIRDLIGPSGIARDQGANGFLVAPDSTTVSIHPGRCYVAGRLFENERLIDFGAQPDSPGAELPAKEGKYLAYLEAWQRHISAAEDPEIREAALGGADTATRLKNAWRVNLAAVGDDLAAASVRKAALDLGDRWTPPGRRQLSSGRMRARLAAGAAPELENQLYRVEIHQPGPASQASFKWSRDNGSVVARIEAVEDKTLTLDSGARSDLPGFGAEHWIELTSDAQEARGEPGQFAFSIGAQGRRFRLDRSVQGLVSGLARRWDGEGILPVSDGVHLLENGIEIEFETGPDHIYQSGDYWLIPARSSVQQIQWPEEDEGFQPPHGLQRHFVPLALLRMQGGMWALAEDGDLRRIFSPLVAGTVSKSGDSLSGGLRIEADPVVTREPQPQDPDSLFQEVRVTTASPVALITTTGTIGIGTAAPQASLHIVRRATVATSSEFVQVREPPPPPPGENQVVARPPRGPVSVLLQPSLLVEDGAVELRRTSFRIQGPASQTGEQPDFLSIGRSGNLSLGSTLNPVERVEVGDVEDTRSDTYVKISTAGGAQFRGGLKFRVAGEDVGFTIDSDDRNSEGLVPGLNVRRHASSIDGVSAMFIARNSGNVGLGTTTPVERLELGTVTNTAADNYLKISTSGGSQFRAGIKFRAFADNFGFTIENDDRNSDGQSRGLNILRHEDLEGGVSAMFIARETGNVGLENTRPVERLDLGTATGTRSDSYVKISTAGGAQFRAGLKLRAAGDDVGFTIENDDRNSPNFVPGLNVRRHDSSIDGVSAMFIARQSGNVGIGTRSPLGALHVAGANHIQHGTPLITLQAQEDIAGLGDRRLVNFSLLTQADVAGRGDEQFNSVQPVLGIQYGFDRAAGFGSFRGVFLDADSLQWTVASDRDLKEDIAGLKDVLDKVLAMRPVTFRWKNKGPGSIGLIANELEEIYPELVRAVRTADGSVTRGVQYAMIGVIAIAAIRELAERYDERIARLEQDFGTLKRLGIQ